MTLAEARKILKPPLVFGDKKQIRAREFVEAVGEINALVREKAKSVGGNGGFEDWELARAVWKEFDPDYEDE